MRFDVGGRRKIHRAKPSGVVEGHPCVIFHVKHHMIVFFWRGMVLVKLPKLLARNQHSARHAEMHNQSFLSIQVQQNIF